MQLAHRSLRTQTSRPAKNARWPSPVTPLLLTQMMTAPMKMTDDEFDPADEIDMLGKN